MVGSGGAMFPSISTGSLVQAVSNKNNKIQLFFLNKNLSNKVSQLMHDCQYEFLEQLFNVFTPSQVEHSFQRSVGWFQSLLGN